MAFATSLFIALGSFAPRIGLPILGTPSWASWFDIYVAFPVLAVILGFSLRGLGPLEGLCLGILLGLPMTFHCLASYFWDYGGAYYSDATWFGQFFGSIGVSLALVACLYILTKIGTFRMLADPPARAWLRAGAAVSVSMALGEGLLRPLTTTSLPINSVGDIGITNAWGAFFLIHGVNPFTAAIPPWGGPVSPPYGPMSVLLAAPFAVLPIDAAAHASTFSFAILSAVTIWAILRRIHPPLAMPLATLFLAMPLTMSMMDATASVHFMVTFLILAYIYGVLTKKFVVAGVFLGLATLTFYFPILLLVPFLIFATEGRVKLLASCLIPSGIGAYAAIVELPGRSIGVGAAALAKGGTDFVGYEVLLGTTGGLLLSLGALLVLLISFWEWRNAWKNRTSAFLVSSAILLVSLPAIIGYTYAAFYIWSIAVAIPAIGSLSQNPAPGYREPNPRIAAGSAPHDKREPEKTNQRLDLHRQPGVLLVVPDFPPSAIGGGAKYFERLGREFVSHGCHVEVLSLDFHAKAGPLARPVSLTRDGIEISFLPLFAKIQVGRRLVSVFIPPSILSVKHALRVMSSRRWDIVHIHGPPLVPWCDGAALVAKVRDTPYALTVHLLERDRAKMPGLVWIAYSLWLRFESSLYSNCRATTYVSQHLLSEARQQGLRTKSEKVVVLPREDQTVTSVSGQVKRECLEGYGVTAGRFALSVGSVIPRKGHDIVLRAVKLLHDRHELPPDFACLIAGDDLGTGHLASLRRLSEHLGLSSTVRFVGRVSDLHRDILYETCGFVLLASRDEGSPAVVVEALAHAAPVIASDIAPVRELSGNSPAVKTFEVNCPESLADQMRSLLGNSDGLVEARSDARRLAKSMPSWENVCETYLGLFIRRREDLNPKSSQIPVTD